MLSELVLCACFPVSAPHLLKLNQELAVQLGLNPVELATQAGVEILAGKRIPEGAEPIATAYAGHQFGQFVPQLGDGRAILLGEIVGQEGVRRDIQLKGSGRTPFPAAATSGRRLAPFCASTSSARPWRLLAFRPLGRLLRS